MDNDLQVVKKMLGTLLKAQGLMQTADCWAVGANEGGRFVSLFSSRANFRLCNVYEEQFSRLPDYIQREIPEDCGGEISTEKARVEKKGQLRQCTPFVFTRWKLNPEDEQGKWRYDSLLYTYGNKGTQQPTNGDGQPPPQPAQPAQPQQPTGDLCPHCHAPAGKPHAGGCPNAGSGQPEAQHRGTDHPFNEDFGQNQAVHDGAHGGKPRVNKADAEKLDDLGRQYYGDGWVEKSKELARSVSGDETGDIWKLQPGEAQTLIAGLTERLAMKDAMEGEPA